MLIGEVSQRCGVSTRMLRHYDRLKLVTPTGRTSGGYREYSTDDIRRLFHVESLRTLGLSLSEVKQALDEPGFAPADLVGDLIRHTRRRIAAEEELLGKLERIDASSPAEWEDVLRIVNLLGALESPSAARRQQAILAQDPDPTLPVEALVAAILSEDDANVAGALRWSLARAGGRGLTELAAGLDSTDVKVRRRAVVAVVEIDSAESTPHLRKALGDSDAIVREAAVFALGNRGDGDAIPALLEMVVDGRRDVEAAEVLGLLASESAIADDIVEAMQERLDNTDDPAVRSRITQAFAEIPGTAAEQALGRLTHDNDRQIASTAASIFSARHTR